MDSVEIVEVGPRDGVQSVGTWIPTETKVALIEALIAAGVRRLEVGSFISPKAIPQMRDGEAVVQALPPHPGVRKMALVPNTKGAQRAIAAGIKEIIFVISMSEAHNQSNVRRPIAQSLEDLRLLLEEVDAEGRLGMRIGLATSFDCPFDGRVAEAQVLANVERIVAIREGMELVLSDTTGMAIPAHVRGLAQTCIERFGDAASFAFHGHDTAGFCVANVLVALEAGIRVFDGSVAGLGGCPFAPGATGNVATEDLVYLFHRMGLETGIDLERYLEACELAKALPDGATGGHAGKIPLARLSQSLADTGRAAAE
jgi:hydroxymethylglutaryl-CoA lyase